MVKNELRGDETKIVMALTVTGFAVGGTRIEQPRQQFVVSGILLGDDGLLHF